LSTSEPLTRERVLEEAARLFADRGYSHTRLKDIASAFGVTHAALYYHFERKEDILIELNRRAIQGLLEMAREVDASTDIVQAEKFDHVLYGHALFVAENVMMVASLFEGEYALPEQFKGWLRDERRQYTELVTHMFRAGQKAGRLAPGDANVAVALLFGTATWAYRWYRDTRDWAPGQLAKETILLAARGYLRDDMNMPSLAKDDSFRGGTPRPSGAF